MRNRRLPGQILQPPDQIKRRVRVDHAGIDASQFVDQWIGQGGEEGALKGTTGLHAADGSGRGGGDSLGDVLAFEKGEDLAGTVEDRRGDAGEAGDVDAVALVRAAGDAPGEIVTRDGLEAAPLRAGIVRRRARCR